MRVGRQVAWISIAYYNLVAEIVYNSLKNPNTFHYVHNVYCSGRSVF